MNIEIFNHGFRNRRIANRQRSRARAQLGSLAVESALSLSILSLIMVSGLYYGFDLLILHEDQRAISAELRAKARETDHQSDAELTVLEADEFRIGASKRSAARMIWLKSE